MSKTLKTIIFFGNERLATGVSTTAPTLLGLIKAGYTVKAVVSNYEKGTSRSSRQLEIQSVAKDHNIPVLLPNKLSDIMDQLKSFNAQAGILVAYGKIIPQEAIDIFPNGIINLHPSLLPLHRGPTPIESVMLNGEKKTGMSIMKLVKNMDAGPIYGYSEIQLSGRESKQELADDLLELGGTMLLELLPGILNGQIAAMPQDDSRATYDSLISKDSGLIDWSKPASVVANEIRAYKTWPKSYTRLGGIDLIVTEAEAIETSGRPGNYEQTKNSLIVYCSSGALNIISLQPPGKKEMPIQAFLAGYKL